MFRSTFGAHVSNPGHVRKRKILLNIIKLFGLARTDFYRYCSTRRCELHMDDSNSHKGSSMDCDAEMKKLCEMYYGTFGQRNPEKKIRVDKKPYQSNLATVPLPNPQRFVRKQKSAALSRSASANEPLSDMDLQESASKPLEKSYDVLLEMVMYPHADEFQKRPRSR